MLFPLSSLSFFFFCRRDKLKRVSQWKSGKARPVKKLQALSAVFGRFIGDRSTKKRKNEKRKKVRAPLRKTRSRKPESKRRFENSFFFLLPRVIGRSSEFRETPLDYVSLCRVKILITPAITVDKMLPKLLFLPRERKTLPDRISRCFRDAPALFLPKRTRELLTLSECQMHELARRVPRRDRPNREVRRIRHSRRGEPELGNKTKRRVQSIDNARVQFRTST